MSEPNGRQPRAVRAPMRVSEGGASVGALLTRMRGSAFQGRKLGEAFEAWKQMIDGSALICLGLAGSLSSAGMWPLGSWLIERGYVGLVASSGGNVPAERPAAPRATQP